MKMKQLNHLLAKGTLTCDEVKSLFLPYADIKFIPIEKDETLQAFIAKGW